LRFHGALQGSWRRFGISRERSYGAPGRFRPSQSDPAPRRGPFPTHRVNFQLCSVIGGAYTVLTPCLHCAYTVLTRAYTVLTLCLHRAYPVLTLCLHGGLHGAYTGLTWGLHWARCPSVKDGTGWAIGVAFARVTHRFSGHFSACGALKAARGTLGLPASPLRPRGSTLENGRFYDGFIRQSMGPTKSAEIRMPFLTFLIRYCPSGIWARITGTVRIQGETTQQYTAPSARLGVPAP